MVQHEINTRRIRSNIVRNNALTVKQDFHHNKKLFKKPTGQHDDEEIVLSRKWTIIVLQQHVSIATVLTVRKMTTF